MARITSQAESYPIYLKKLTISLRQPIVMTSQTSYRVLNIMNKIWQVQEAKAHFSELIKEVRIHGAQKITLRGELVAVVISDKEYEKLKGYKISIIEFLKKSPLFDVELDLKRDKSLIRKFDL